MFEEAYERLWQNQVREAEGQRAEMLRRDLAGTRLLLRQALLPVLGTLDGLVLEHEMSGPSGVKIYADVFHPGLRVVFEEDHYVTHAEKVTRERFSFERARARTIAVFGYVYFPYSRDELEKKPASCQRSLYELIGRIGAAPGSGLLRLPVYEREVIRCAMLGSRTFRLSDVSLWLGLTRETCSKIMRSMRSNGWVAAVGGSDAKCHEFRLTESALELLHRHR